jgi:protein-serine/threonine kinase
MAAEPGNQPRNEAPELSLPFIGYTFKHFDTFNNR